MIRVICSKLNNPYYNLALEEMLFDVCENTSDFILYLWQNDNTIVIGRNQDVFIECNIKYALSSGTKIVRRMTGGGAVFHDLGNLNYTMIVPKDCYVKEQFGNIIIKALNELGIKAELDGRNDIIVDGLKCSGNAYYSSKNTILHHGTMMVDVDLKKMEQLLSTSKSKISRRGIKSVHSRVKNLREINEKITIELLKAKIISTFCKEFFFIDEIYYGATKEELSRLTEIQKKYESKDWNYNQIAEYDISIEENYEWGNIELKCELSGTKITNFLIFSDSLYPELIDSVVKHLQNSDLSIFNPQNFFAYDAVQIEIVQDIELLYNKILKMIDV